MSKLEVDAIEPQSGTTITIGAAGDTVNLVGTLQTNGSALPGDISSVVAGTGLSGGGTSGPVTLNIDSAQPTITSLGTITSFRSTGIDDNSNALAITIDSNENVGIGVGPTTTSASGATIKGLVIGGNNGNGVFTGLQLLNRVENSTTSNGIAIDFDHKTSGSTTIPLARVIAKPSSSTSGDLQFYTSSSSSLSERMRLNSTGLALKTSAPAVTLDVRATSFTPYNTNTSLITEAPAVFSQAQHFYIYNAGAFNNSRPTGGIGAVNASSLISLSAGSICTANPGADGFKATATSSSLYDIGSGNHEFKTKTGLTVGDQFTHQTKMIIKDSGNVGIGTTSPSTTLDVNGTITANGLHMSDNEYIRQGDSSPQEFEIFTIGSSTKIRSPGSAAHSIAIQPGGSGSVLITNSSSQNIITQQADSAYLHFAGSTKLRTTTNGLVVSGGIVFDSATDNDANRLDDYEEGSFTPSFAASSCSFNYTQRFGNFTKIGRVVHCKIFLRGQASGSTSQALKITGLPFTSSNTNGMFASCTFGQIYIVDLTDASRIVGQVGKNNTQIDLQFTVDNSASANLVASAIDNSTSAGFIVDVTYFTDA